jgi:hypothetical protein
VRCRLGLPLPRARQLDLPGVEAPCVLGDLARSAGRQVAYEQERLGELPNILF